MIGTKRLISIAFIATSAYSLEFGYMGNRAFGMGGSGTAFVANPFAIYYNPALLGLDSSVQVGYSLGLSYKEHNIGNLSNQNIEAAKSFLDDNSLNITSQNGLSVAIPLTHGEMFSSSIGFGLFYTKIGTVNFLANSSSSNDRIDARMIINGLDLVEIPLSYALNISSVIGNFGIGINAKYINASHSLTNKEFSGDNAIEYAFNQALKSSNGINTNTFGVDVGLSYALPFNTLVIGIVGKNLNAPDINTRSIERFKLEPQYRLGISTNAIPLTTLALDLDLTPNTEFRGLDNAMEKKQVQYISLGGEVSLAFMDLRLGIAKNLANGSKGLLVYGGLGFKIIDVSLFSSTDMTQGISQKIPREFGIKLGGGFSF